MGLLERISAARAPARSITDLDSYLATLNAFHYQGNTYPLAGVQTTMGTESAERISNDLTGYAQSAFAANGPVFSCMLVRQLVFSAVRFTWQRLRDGRPSDMFGTADLSVLETPWPGGTTQDLANRLIQDADLAGNAFNTTETPLPRIGGDGGGRQVVRLRPDWVEIVLEARRMPGQGSKGVVGFRRFGYLYTEGGPMSGNDPVPFLPSEVSHFAPIPDPLASYRGMSWLTPVLRELQTDGLMVRHQRKFFENAATPNMIVTFPKEIAQDKLKQFKARMDAGHAGADNAYKTLYLGGGADVTVVGSNFEQMDFKNLQGRGETRIASAAGVPPVIAGFSEGLAAATYSNYAQARRRFADGTMHPLWQNAAGSLAPLVPRPRPLAGEDPSSVRLWYDARDVPFLREDEKDAAEIAFMRAQTLRQYIEAGYKPESAVAALDAQDERLLEHTGLFSVQLQPAGSQQTPALPSGGSDDDGQA